MVTLKVITENINVIVLEGNPETGEMNTIEQIEYL